MEKLDFAKDTESVYTKFMGDKKKLQPYERSSKLSMNDIVVNNFIGGVAWALGATIGLSLILTILTILAKDVNLVPIIGGFVSKIINFILATNPNLHK
jgi:hypothetical protein